MKQKITLLVLAAIGVMRMNAQLVLTENFASSASVTAHGWIKINSSSPVGTTSWFMGNAGIFHSYNGPDTSYFAANYNNTTGSQGTISNWLISPTVTLNNGGVIQFATRTNTAAAGSIAPDRLELYVSTAGTGSNVGGSSSSVGTFSTLLVSVNPNLTTSGYPSSWTVYTATLSNITGTVTGRFGFRYDVTSAGPTGTNSSYIGIDAINYLLPCPNPTLSVSSSTNGICSGNIVTLTASGANTYTWSTGQTTSSIVVSPAASAVYTVTGSSTPNCNSVNSIALTVTVTPNVAVSDVTTCPGTTATLTASGASSYVWSTGSVSDTTLVTPLVSGTYSVTGYNGVCENTQYVSVTLGASLSINAFSSQGTICSGTSATLTGSGASTYTWLPGNLNTRVITVTPSVTTTYTLNGSSGTCGGTATQTITLIPSPSVSIIGSPALTAGSVTLCPSSGITFTASGAVTYSWINSNNSTSIFSVITPSTAQTVTYGVVGAGSNNCTSKAVVTVINSVCTGIESHQASVDEVSFYPNPFGNELKTSGISGRIELYNALGQLVLKQDIALSESLATDDLPKGIYILKAFNSQKKQVSTVKLIRN